MLNGSNDLFSQSLVPYLFCSLAVLNQRVGHTMDSLSPLISVLCHSDWLCHGESCPHLDVVQPGRAWPSYPACTWHCSLHYLLLQATFPCFLMLWPQYASMSTITLVLSTLTSRLYSRLTRSRRSTNSCSSASEVANIWCHQHSKGPWSFAQSTLKSTEGLPHHHLR